jgi:predicted nucleic acid-binding Zn ribbon protein
MDRSCPECGAKIIGRADKKFCSDACRNSYNNALNKDRKNLVRTINNRLRKNYRILESLNKGGKTKVSKEQLLKQGFSFDYVTSLYTTKSGAVYYYLYDQGYLPLDNNWYLLVKKERV